MTLGEYGELRAKIGERLTTEMSTNLPGSGRYFDGFANQQEMIDKLIDEKYRKAPANTVLNGAIRKRVHELLVWLADNNISGAEQWKVDVKRPSRTA